MAQKIKAPFFKKGWWKKIPPDVLLSPGGIILIFLALIIELCDLILPGVAFLEYIIEIPLEIVFLFLLAKIADYPLKAMIVPFVIERVPILSDVLPTWFLKLFV